MGLRCMERICIIMSCILICIIRRAQVLGAARPHAAGRGHVLPGNNIRLFPTHVFVPTELPSRAAPGMHISISMPHRLLVRMPSLENVVGGLRVTQHCTISL